MSGLIKQLKLQAGINDNPDQEGLDLFAKLIITHIVEKIEQEAELAWTQEQSWTNATLNALSLEILEDFDMEISDE